MAAPAALGEALHALADQAAAFEALLLIASGIHKGFQWSHLQAVVHAFGGVPRSLAPAVLAGVAAWELAAGGLLFMPAWRTTGALLATVIWTSYLVLIVRALLQGRRTADCGCSFGPTQRPLGAYHVLRNMVLSSLALAVGMDAGHVSVGGMQGSHLLAACALLALYGALDQVMGLQPLRKGELS